MVPSEGVEILQVKLCLGAGRGRFHDRVGDVFGQSRRLVIEVAECDLVGARQQILRGSTLPRVVLLLEVRPPKIVFCLSSLLRLPNQDVRPGLIQQLPLRRIVQYKYRIILSFDMEDLILLENGDRVIILIFRILLGVCLGIKVEVAT